MSPRPQMQDAAKLLLNLSGVSFQVLNSQLDMAKDQDSFLTLHVVSWAGHTEEVLGK